MPVLYFCDESGCKNLVKEGTGKIRLKIQHPGSHYFDPMLEKNFCDKHFNEFIENYGGYS